MTDRIAEQGAVTYGVANASTEPASRLGAAGWIQGKIKDNANSGLTNPATRSTLAGKLQYQASQTFALNLDFTTGTLDSRITFTRSGATATRTNSSGLIETVAANTARFDYKYNGSTWDAAGLLIEEARTNLTKYSEAISDASWAKTNCTVSANSVAAPDGNTTADKIIPSVGSVIPYVERSGANGPAVTSGTTYTDSYYIKPGDFRYFALLETGSGTGSGYVICDTQTVTITGAGNGATTADGTITSVGNGWYRFTYTKASTVTGNWTCRLYASGSGTSITNVTGDGSIGFYAWGVQTEAGSFPTSYIPTTSASVTRNADVAEMTGTNFSDWFNATEGTFYIKTNLPSYAASVRAYFAISNGTSAERIELNNAPTVGVFGVTANAPGNATIINSGNSFTYGQFWKACVAYKVDDSALCLNGGTVGTDTTSTIPTVNKLSIGVNGHQAPAGQQWIKTLRYYNVRKSNADLQALTA